MSYITIGLCTDHTDWISTVIRWLTWSDYSHVVLISEDGQCAIEATHGKPVRPITIYEFLARDRATIRRIPHPNPTAVWDEAWSQLGKPYDWKFSWGWFFRRHWQDKDAWACSELIAWAAERGGKRLFPSFFDKITADHFFMLSEELPTKE